MLAGTVETAVNALWDAAPLVGDRIAVVGAGMVGCCVAAVLAALPGRAGAARRRRPGACRRRGGARRDFALPADAAGDCDLVVHASATSAGLTARLELLGDGGRGHRAAAGTATGGERAARARPSTPAG